MFAIYSGTAMIVVGGVVVPAGGATIEVRREDTGALATIYSDEAGTTPITNPSAFADSEGRFTFYAKPVERGYSVKVTSGAVNYTLHNVAVMATTAARNLKDYGAVCDGTTDDTSALNAAIADSAGRTLVITGTPLISSTVVLNQKVRIAFEGGRGSSAAAKPSSYIKKKSTMTTIGLQITNTDVVIEGGGVVADTGSTGGGVAIEANSVMLRDFTAIGAGGSSGVGIRVGKDSSGANCNSWLLLNCNSAGWSSHGFFVHDNPGAAPNANAGNAIACFANGNGGDGFRCDNATLNNFIGCLGEANTGNGLTMGNTSARSTTNQWCVGNYVIGGDYEGNTAGQLVFNLSSYKCGYKVPKLSVVVTDNGYFNSDFASNNFGGRVAWTPGVAGSTGTDKSITATSFAGSVCTATSTAHGYSNGDAVWIRGASNFNVNGVFTISNVTANTFDFTVRSDAQFDAPTGTMTATARKCGVYSKAVGHYEFDKSKVFFHAHILTTAVTNITGTLQLILPILPANISADSWGEVNIVFYTGITHTGQLRVLIQENAAGVNQNFYEGLASAGTPTQFGAAGIAAATEIILSGWYYWQ